MSQKSSVMQLPQFIPKALTSDRFKSYPRNHLNLLQRPGTGYGTGLLLAGIAERQDSRQFTHQVDAKLAFLGGQRDLLHQRADEVWLL